MSSILCQAIQNCKKGGPLKVKDPLVPGAHGRSINAFSLLSLSMTASLSLQISAREIHINTAKNFSSQGTELSKTVTVAVIIEQIRQSAPHR